MSDAAAWLRMIEETMMRKLLIAGLVPVVMVAGAFLWMGAAAGGAAPGMGHRLAETPIGRLVMGRIGRAMVLKSELNVTSEQRQQIKTIVMSHKAELVAAAKPVVAKKQALRDAVLAEKPDDKAIQTASAELGKAIGDAAVVVAKVKVELAKVMTPEQMKLLEKFHAENDAAVSGIFRELEGK